MLLGGQPARMLRLTVAGARLVAAWRAGEPVGSSVGAQALAKRLVDAGLVHPRPEPRAADDVAVVIPAHGRPDVLAACVARVGSCAEVVIVDDGSPVPLAGQKRTSGVLFSPAAVGETRIVRRDARGGPAAARNAGLAATSAPFVAFLDSDTLPTPGWLETVMGHFDDPRVAAVAPRVRVPRGETAIADYEAVRSPLDLGDAPGIVGPGRRIGFVPAAALVVRRAALGSSAPFDEAMRYGEDVDLVWRLAAAGWTVRYEPAAVVEHPHRASARAWLAQRAAYGSSAGPLARRHPGRMRHLVVPPAALAPWVLALAGRPRLALGAALAVTARAVQRGAHRPGLAKLALEGQVRAAGQIATAAWRPYAPLLATTRRGRRLLAVTLAANVLADRPALDLPRHAVLRAADDLAYAAGVLAGCVHSRTLSPLLPATPRSTLNSTVN